MIASNRVNHSPDMPLSLPRMVISLENLSIDAPDPEGPLPRPLSLNGLQESTSTPVFHMNIVEGAPTIDPPSTPTKDEVLTARTVDLNDSQHSTVSASSHVSSVAHSPRRDRTAIEGELHKATMMDSLSHAVALALFHRHLHTKVGAPIGASVHLLEDLTKSHIRSLPERYLLTPVDDVIDHMILMHEAVAQNNFQLLVRRIAHAPPDVNRIQVTISCPDKAKVYNLISASLDRVSISTFDGEIMTSKNGIVSTQHNRTTAIFIIVN